MTPQDAIAGRYGADLRPKGLYPAFHSAAADLAAAEQRPYADCIGDVFAVLAGFAGIRADSGYLGKVLTMMHRDGRLAAAIQGPALAASSRCAAV